VPGVTRKVDANSAAVGLPGWAPRRRRICPRADSSSGDIGADAGQSHAVEAAGGRILAAAAFRVAGARDTERATRAAVAIGIAGLAATAATGAGARALVAIAHALTDVVLVAVADAAAGRAAGLALLGADGRCCWCRADPRLTRLAGRAGCSADPAVDRAGHQVGAVVAAVGRAGGTLRSDAYAVLTVGVDAGVPRDRTTGVTASAAVLVVATQVPAKVDRAAILDANRAISPLADAAAAFDRDQSTFANLAARTAVVQVGLEIDADLAAGGLT
jgi:hypothetical protein